MNIHASITFDLNGLSTSYTPVYQNCSGTGSTCRYVVTYSQLIAGPVQVWMSQMVYLETGMEERTSMEMKPEKYNMGEMRRGSRDSV